MGASVDPRFEAELRRGVVQLVALRLLEKRLPGSLQTSALEGTGMQALRDEVYGYVTRRHVDVVIEGDPGNGKLLSHLREWGEVGEVTYPDGVVRVAVRIAPRYLDRIRQAGGEVVTEGSEPE